MAQLLDPDATSRAIVVYMGYGVSRLPDCDPVRLSESFGSLTAADLLPVVYALVHDFCSTKRKSRNQFRDARRAASVFSQRHPTISKAALDALAWAYAIDNR